LEKVKENIEDIKETTETIDYKMDVMLKDVNYLMKLIGQHVKEFEEFTDEEKADFELLLTAMDNKDTMGGQLRDMLASKTLDQMITFILFYGKQKLIELGIY
jgi:hypothetical protein